MQQSTFGAMPPNRRSNSSPILQTNTGRWNSSSSAFCEGAHVANPERQSSASYLHSQEARQVDRLSGMPESHGANATHPRGFRKVPSASPSAHFQRSRHVRCPEIPAHCHCSAFFASPARQTNLGVFRLKALTANWKDTVYRNRPSVGFSMCRGRSTASEGYQPCQVRNWHQDHRARRPTTAG